MIGWRKDISIQFATGQKRNGTRIYAENADKTEAKIKKIDSAYIRARPRPAKRFVR